MRREARLARAGGLQHTRAGLVSRVAAIALDLGVVFLLQTAIFAVVTLVWWVISGSGRVDAPRADFAVGFNVVLLVIYLGYLWSTTGRTVGEQILGLRTVTEQGGRVSALRAYTRACLTVILPIGLLWILVSRRNAAVQDLLCRTAVVYDWAYHPPAS